MIRTPTPDGLPAADPALPIASNRPSIFQWFTHLGPNPETVVLLLAVLIGTGAGSGVVIFRFLIDTIHQAMWERVSGVLSVWGHWTLVLIPLIGGLAIGFMRWILKDLGPGLSTLLEMVQGGKELLPLKPVSKMLAAAISLGSGASLGPEGPSVEIGANFSLLLGQALKVSQERQRLLLSAGAAAGLAAGFNAPIAGAFFALEVVLGTTFATSAVSVVLLSSVVAAWIAQIGLGFQPAFSLPAYEVRSLLELPLYIGLGLCASVVSIIYKQSISFAQKAFQGHTPGLQWLATIPVPLHPVLGGLVIGLVALWFPQILGVGYETVESILQDVQFPLHLVALLLLVKLGMTAWSFGSGFVGGVFAPALFLGASLGSAYGKLLAIAFPMLHPYMASPPAYAMVGMAAVLAGSVRAPLTAILLLFEMTQDYRIVLPLMAAVGLSIWLVERLQPTTRLDSDGEQADAASEVSLDTGSPVLMVADAMRLPSLQCLEDTPLGEAVHLLLKERQHCVLVVSPDGNLQGILSLQDINRALTRADSPAAAQTLTQQPIHLFCTHEMLSVYPDDLLADAIARMSTRGLHQLPVVDRENPQRAIGLLTEEDIHLSHRLARIKEILHRQSRVTSVEQTGMSAANPTEDKTPIPL